MINKLLILWSLVGSVSVSAGALPVMPFNLTILHTNDIHSRFEEANVNGGRCSEVQTSLAQCYGGIPRLAHLTRQIRERQPNSIYVDAGDLFQGTPWYTIQKWSVVSHFANLLNLTAMALGNHEFDDGIDGLLPFLEAANHPIVTSNIQSDRQPGFSGQTSKSIVIEIGGRDVGIIGYTFPNTPLAANTGNLTFTDEIEAINDEAQLLSHQGVGILLALGHSGYGRDLEIAQHCPLIDVVIGAHSHSFLWNGPEPSLERSMGPYPTMVKQDSTGRHVPVVQAYTNGKYLGNLLVTFDAAGEVVAASGEPILLDANIPQAADVLQALVPWREEVEAMSREEIATTRVFLDGDRVTCGRSECNFGNLITDSFVSHFTGLARDDEWSKTSIAFINAGSIRGSIDEQKNNGSITTDDILTYFPFSSSIDIIEITGQTMKDAFEHSVSEDPVPVWGSGRFLQSSGVQVTYDLTRTVGDRVIELVVRCRRCRVPTYEPIQLDDIYQVATPSFLIDGGDGYSVIKENLIGRHSYGTMGYDVIIEYMKQSSAPFTVGLERRVRFSSRQSEERILKPMVDQEEQ